MTRTLYDRLTVNNPSYVPRETGIALVKDLMDTYTRNQRLASLPAYKTRRLEREICRAERELLKIVPRAKDLQFYVECNLTKKAVELSRGNEYVVCAVAPQIKDLTEAEIKKIKAYKWVIIKKALNLAKAEIIWKFRNDALLFPSLALHMKLTNSKRCPLCDRDSTGVKHYIACERAS